jgi:hypothetical protein
VRRAFVLVLVLATVVLSTVLPAAPVQAKDWPVAVILVYFPDPPESQSKDEGGNPGYYRSLVFGSAAEDPYSVRQYYREQSYGKLDITGAIHSTGDVYGPYPLRNGDGAYCNLAQIAGGAQQAAQADGFDAQRYKGIVHLYSSNRCGGGGAGQTPGPYVWVNGSATRYVIEHELGHTFGNDHAQSLRCHNADGSVATLSARCDEPDEYGDPFDPMGRGGSFSRDASFGYSESIAHQMEPTRKLKMGVLGGSDVRIASAGGRYHLEPNEKSSGVRMLRVPARDGKYFDLSFRQPIGVFDSTWADKEAGNPRAFDGVLVTLDPAKYGYSQLLDMTPETPGGPEDPFEHRPTTGFEDAPLREGRSFTDPFTGVSLKVLDTGAGGADVTVTYGLKLSGLKLPKPFKLGTTSKIGYTLGAAPARVTVTYTQTVAGRSVKVGAVSYNSKAGASSFSFDGRIGGKQRFKAGTYRVSVVATAGDIRSNTVTGTLTVTG